jgi:hypothetical protein
MLALPRDFALRRAEAAPFADELGADETVIAPKPPKQDFFADVQAHERWLDHPKKKVSYPLSLQDLEDPVWSIPKRGKLNAAPIEEASVAAGDAPVADDTDEGFVSPSNREPFPKTPETKSNAERAGLSPAPPLVCCPKMYKPGASATRNAKASS